MRAAIHQVLPVFAGADAIGQHTLALQRVLRRLGVRSEIYARDIHAEVRAHAKPLERFEAVPGERTFLLYQLSTGGPVADWVASRPEPLLLDYHNITPAELFDPWEPAVGVELRVARQQLAQLAPRALVGMADSAYNAAELEAAGCASPVVVPILLDPAHFDGDGDAAVARRLQAQRAAGGGAVWLFVGRVAPNKAQHDVVKAFALYRAVVDPGARLVLVGSPVGGRYPAAVAALVEGLGLSGCVEMPGSVSAAALAAYYRSADVFVCLSDHEGFCVPLLEAFHHGVPVVAFGSSAVPETAGSGAVVVPDKSPAVVATAVARVLGDAGLRSALVAAGRRRLADFAPERTEAVVAGVVERLLAA